MNTKVAIVTGASSGVGAAVATLLIEKGFKVYGWSRRGNAPEGAEGMPVDVTNPQQLTAAVQQVINQQGAIQLVVHAAGISGSGPIEQMPLAEARKIMETNFFGSYNLAQAVVPQLREQAAPTTLIMVSSITGLLAIPFRGVYSASKFALEALVESLRLETRNTHLRVVSVCPGDVQTPILHNQYRMPPEEVAAVYRPAFSQAEAEMDSNVGHGLTPEAVAEAIWAIVQKPKPRVRYPVGALVQKASTLAKRLLPSKTFEGILANYYKLNQP